MSKTNEAKKCKYCQSEIDKKAKVCPVCKRNLKGHGCLIPIAVFFLMLIATLIYAVAVGEKDSEATKKKARKQNEQDNLIASKYIDVTDKQSKQIDKILKKCGIKNIVSFEHDPMLDEAHSDGETGYRITNDRARNIILCLNKNKKVHNIAYASHKLYTKNKVVAKIQDYTISMKEIAKWQDFCQEQVINILKSPRSAKFPNYTKWGFDKDEKHIIVQGYVDAENSFGAEIRNKFQLKINKESEIVESFIFDGEELIK